VNKLIISNYLAALFVQITIEKGNSGCLPKCQQNN